MQSDSLPRVFDVFGASLANPRPQGWVQEYSLFWCRIWTKICDSQKREIFGHLSVMTIYFTIITFFRIFRKLERTLDSSMTMVCSWQGGLELCKSKPVPPLLPLDGAQMQSSLSPPFHNNTLIKSYLILAYLIISYSCLKSNFFGLKFLFLLNVKSIENQKKLCFQTAVFVHLQL